MNDAYKTEVVMEDDTLSKIALRNKVPLREILKANPKITDLHALQIGQTVKVPNHFIHYVIRFVNLFNHPPEGIKYKVLQGQKELIRGVVKTNQNEAEVNVRHGSVLTISVKMLGSSEYLAIGHVKADRQHPVVVAKVKSAKINAKTKVHPKSDQNAPVKSKPAASEKKTEQGVDHQAVQNESNHPEHKIIPGDCACGKDLTLDQLAAIYPSRKKKDLEEYLVPMNEMFQKYSIDTCMRKSHALAQIGHESGSLRFRAEILPVGTKEADVYDGYKGRGLIQLTYKNNYQRYGDYIKEDFLGDRRSNLETVKWATDSAGWYWTQGASENLNGYADANDLMAVTVAINGAFNGFDDREHIFKRAHKALNASACKIEKNRSSEYLSFEKSAIYNMRDATFAWGYWSEVGSPKKGVTKNADNCRAGFKRFLELNNVKPIKKSRFGFKKKEDMVEHALEKSQ